MSAYVAGQYRVIQFDRVGTRLGFVPAESFVEALAVGRAEVSRATCHSFAVVRVLYNSLQPNFENFDVRTR